MREQQVCETSVGVDDDAWFGCDDSRRARGREGKTESTEQPSLVSARAIGALACGGGEMPNTMRDGSVTARLLHCSPKTGVPPSQRGQAGLAHTGNPCLALWPLRLLGAADDVGGTASTKPAWPAPRPHHGLSHRCPQNWELHWRTLCGCLVPGLAQPLVPKQGPQLKRILL